VEKSVTTLEHRPPEGAEYEPYRADALGLIARGLTAEGVRAHAGDELYLRRIAPGARRTAEGARTEMLAIADAIEAWEAHGLTREKAYFLARLDETYGPYPGPDSLNVA
jgi:hypothetical protein